MLKTMMMMMKVMARKFVVMTMIAKVILSDLVKINSKYTGVGKDMSHAQMVHKFKIWRIKSPFSGPRMRPCPRPFAQKTGVHFRHNLLQWQIVFLDRFYVN